jgi:hypothetical protein
MMVIYVFLTQSYNDRLEIDKHYTLENCRYLEWLVNIGNGSRARKGTTRKGRK